MPTVDIVIPTRNRADMTAEAIRSVQGQTHQDWQLYVVDDASDDGSAQFLRSQFEQDPRIRFLQLEKRLPVAAVRQWGFDRGSAPLFAMLDSDDWWLPTKLERQVAAMELAVSTDVVLCWHQWLRPDGSVRVTRRPTGSGTLSPLITNNFDAPLIRRDFLRRIGAFTPAEGTPPDSADNTEFFVRLLARGNALIVEEVLVQCRDHNHARSSDALRERQGALDLLWVVNARQGDLRGWPREHSALLARTAIRFGALGDVAVASRLMWRGLALGSFQQKAHFIQEWGPPLVRASLKSLSIR